MSRWRLDNLGNNKIIWDASKNEPHTDHIEMSGKYISAIVNYGTGENGAVLLRRNLYYPVLRTIPNNTHATANQAYGEEINIRISVDGKEITEKPFEIIFDGIITIKSSDEAGKIIVARYLFPSTDKPMYIEHILIKNISPEEVFITIEAINDIRFERGVKGIYKFEVKLNGISEKIKPQDCISADLIFTGQKIHDEEIPVYPNRELSNRMSFINDIFNENLVLESSNPQIDCEFAFAKLRACESVFETECGLIHSPGGGPFYAAVWTNDQLEYHSPLAPFIGTRDINQAALNAYNLYIPFMGSMRSNYKCIPSSVIAEGRDIWEGAGDRGDAAMYFYGLTRFLLAYGDKKTAEKYFSALEWCADFCKTKMNGDGVIESDSDELEGRFPSGGANLCTSSLAYGGFVSAAQIAKELGYSEKHEIYLNTAEKLSADIEKYFGANISGYDTYRYYKENNILRAWICVPLTVGIYKRAPETMKALLSERLWTENGILTQEGDNTFWDRATLYALRGIFNSGENKDAYKYLVKYTEKRLLGDHVPYPVEAYPEGGQRHLSAESALYCRVITEGIAGITPSGFRSFYLKPSFPKEIGFIKLKNIKAFMDDFDLEIEKDGCVYNIIVKMRDGMEKKYICGEIEQIEINL